MQSPWRVVNGVLPGAQRPGSHPAFVALQRFDLGGVTWPVSASFTGCSGRLLSSALTLEESPGLSVSFTGCSGRLPKRWWESLRVCGCLVINPLTAYGKDWNLVDKKIGAAP